MDYNNELLTHLEHLSSPRVLVRFVLSWYCERLVFVMVLFLN